VVNFSSCEHKRLIRDDHFVPIGSYAQGYPLRLGMERKARRIFGAAQIYLIVGAEHRRSKVRRRA
jgi:hypothetical protein